MAPKKTTKKPVTKTTKVSKKSTPATEAVTFNSGYRSGDITRLSVMSLLLGSLFLLGLLLGLSLGAKTARVDIAKKIDKDGRLTLKNEIRDEVLAELEEAKPAVPAPEPEVPLVDIISETDSVDTGTETSTETQQSRQTLQTTAPEADLVIPAE